MIQWRGKPNAIRVDNGTEYTSKDFALWVAHTEIRINYIQPGRPMQNGFIELLMVLIERKYWFFELNDVRQLTEQWVEEYNNNRPHEALNNNTPNEWKNLTDLINHIKNATIEKGC